MRLAYEQGLLKQRSLNFFQHWALMYWAYMDRRTRIEDKDAELEQQTFNLMPERWVELYKDQLFGALGIANEEGEVPLTEDDLDELDKFMERLEKGNRFSMSGADAPQEFRKDWGSWT